MKIFAIINGKRLITVSKKSLSDARDYAINICDHSDEIIVREINEHVDISTNDVRIT